LRPGDARERVPRGEASGSFLKKRTKKLLFMSNLGDRARVPDSKRFCFFFQEETLLRLAIPPGEQPT
jgi:hypothetical protein